jgi:Flp pilus assembly protein TadD
VFFDLFGRKGLANIAARSGGKRLYDVVLATFRGDHHDRHAFRVFDSAKRFDEFQPVHNWHVDIAEDKVDRFFSEGGKRFGTVSSLHDFVEFNACLAQRALHNLAHHRGVIHYECPDFFHVLRPKADSGLALKPLPLMFAADFTYIGKLCVGFRGRAVSIKCCHPGATNAPRCAEWKQSVGVCAVCYITKVNKLLAAFAADPEVRVPMKRVPSIQQEQAQPAAKFSLVESSRAQKLILCLLLVLATVALYNPATRAPFFNLDDDLYVTQNPDVRAGLTKHSIIWAFKSTAETNWHPVTWLSHEFDCQVFGLNPAGPHAVSVLLHAASAVILFLMLVSVTGMAWRSLMVSALFALHPLNVESVAWISERKNVLSMILFLLALTAYGWYARSPRVARYSLVTVLYALALMAKPQVITFPFALLLLDYWPLFRIRSDGGPETQVGTSLPSLVLEKIPWFALSAASALITMKVQSVARHAEIPLWMHWANAALAYVKYIGKAFWPENLAPLYPHPGGSINIPAAMLAAVGIVAISVLAVIFRERRYVFVGWFWFLGTLVPMIGLVQVGVQSMADRYAYIPLLGIFVIVVWGTADLLRSLRIPVIVPAVLSAIVLVALGFALHRQVDFWTDNFTLWRHTLDITQRNFIAEDSAGTALLIKGRSDEAVQYFRRANEIKPADPVSTLNVATYEQQHQDPQGAVEGYEKVLHLTENPELVALAYTNEGYAYLDLKDYERSRRAFEAALQQQPENANVYIGLGIAAQQLRDWAGAERDFNRAIEIQPNPRAYELLAQVLEASGKKDEAARTRAAGNAASVEHGAAVGGPSQAIHAPSPNTP